MNRERVLVAMSGGVDSAVAALTLKKAGYEVLGVTMAIWPAGSEEEERHKEGCCSLGAAEDARATAEALGIEHYTLNLRDEFHRDVVADFEATYLAGRTPNPCITCNRTIKFGALMDKARELSADFLATGHYAELKIDEDGSLNLRRARDLAKDQSYVLYPVPQETLRRTLFPIGHMTKPEVRQMAREAGLPIWNKPDSVEICFVAGDYRDYLRERRPEAISPGPIVDREGRVLGEHAGVAFFTIGQRRGLGVKPESVDQDALYVTAIRPLTREVVVGPRHEAESVWLQVTQPRWLAPKPRIGQPVKLKVRAHGPLVGAQLMTSGPDGVGVLLDQPMFAVTPGQAAVWYVDDRVVGGGTIDWTRSAGAPAA